MTLAKLLDHSDPTFMVALFTYAACVLPFALPGLTRMARSQWRDDTLPGTRVAAALFVAFVAIECSCLAALAMAGEFERFRGLAPEAFQFGVYAGLITNAVIVAYEMVRQFSDKPSTT